MPFEIVRNDITNMQVDAIVNAASRKPKVNPGVDLAIHKKAGPKLLKARIGIGDIAVGDAAITPAYNLDARYVIHAPSPVWIDGSKDEAKMLFKTYRRCLQLAVEHGCDSIAFPLLASGNHGFPKDRAIQIAVHAFSEFLMKYDIHIYLVVFGKESFQLSEKLVQNISSYIDEHYVDEYEQNNATLNRLTHREQHAQRRAEEIRAETPICTPADMCAKGAVRSALKASVPGNLTEFLKQKDASFAVTLVELIERSGKKNSEVYKKANVDKKLFSKIINNIKYHPSKQTAVAFAIALELNLEQTQDLIGRAGYTLTHSSKFDLIIEYFILKKQYNIFEINEVLFQFDEVPLGY